MNKIENRTIAIKALVGSHNYNLNTPKSDYDYKYFVYPTFQDLYSGKMFSTGKQSEDLDYTIHDIRTLPHLIYSANINFIEILYSKSFTYSPEFSDMFTFMRKEFSEMNLPKFYTACIGMCNQKIAGMHKGTATTQKDVDRLGYDPKAASHALRCLYTLSKYCETRDMGKALWYEKDDIRRNALLHIKEGRYHEDNFMFFIQRWHMNEADKVAEFFSHFEPDIETKEKFDKFIMKIVEKSLTGKTS